MDFIKMLREDNGLADLLCDVCDIEIFPEFKMPQDECGHLAYHIYCTKRQPRFVSTYAENDVSTHSGTGSLFDR